MRILTFGVLLRIFLKFFFLGFSHEYLLLKSLALMAACCRKTKADFECIVDEPLECGLEIVSEGQVKIVIRRETIPEFRSIKTVSVN